MQLVRRRHGRSSAWIQAVIFNSLLILLPVIGARVLSSALAEHDPNGRLTPEILSETQIVMGRSFGALTAGVRDPRAVWAERVRAQLVAQDMSAARGFLLAAPAMLDGETVRAIHAAADAEPSGSEDQRVVRAALLFLPDDVRAQYETLVSKPGLVIDLMPEPPTDTEGETAEASLVARSQLIDRDETPRATPAPLAIETVAAFSVLGTQEDLVTNSQRWLAGDQVDDVVLRLTGLAHIAGDLPTAEAFTSDPIEIDADEVAVAASVLKTAWRSGRLKPSYARLIRQRVESAMPRAALENALQTALDGVATRRARVTPVKAAFVQSLDLSELARLVAELEQVSAIAGATSPTGALVIIEHAQDGRGVRHAKRIAVAGSDRAVALVKEIGPEALDQFRARVRWNQTLVLQVMGLAAASMALIWAMLSAIGRSFSQQVRRPSIL